MSAAKPPSHILPKMSKAMALYRFRPFLSRPLRPANLKPISRKPGVFSCSFSGVGPLHPTIAVMSSEQHSEIRSANVLSRLSIFDVFPRPQVPSEETLAETKGQEKKKAEEKKNESDLQAHKPVIDGGNGYIYGSEASIGQPPLEDVDSTARNTIENADSQEADVGGSASEHGGDYGGGADAGGSVGDFGGFGGFGGFDRGA